MAGERYRLMAEALHQTAVTADHIRVMIDKVVAKAVVRQPLGKRHAHCGRNPLTKRPGRRLNTRCMAIFRMAWGLRPPLPKRLDFIECDVLIAGQEQQSIKKHRTVPG